MNIAEYSIRHSVIIWLMVVVTLIGGIYSYFNLGRLEDPEFTIKEAMVITHYPGATPEEVEKEVTDRLEKSIFEMGQIKRVESISTAGMSQITVVIQDKYTKNDLPQVWDELRRKVNDVKPELPPGVEPPIVTDDYGDVYGMLLAITGEGINFQALKDYAEVIKKHLSIIPGVAKVTITGTLQQTIHIEISRTRMAKLGISIDDLTHLLSTQNLVLPSGSVRVGDEYIRITPTGTFSSVKAIGNLLIRSPRSDRLLHLDDIATITRDYEEVPKHLAYYNGKPALTMGISIVSGGNVVKIGEKVSEALKKMRSIIPVGVDVKPIYFQPDLVNESIQNFIISLGQALLIVVVVLLIYMGLRSGLLIASILLLSVLGTFLVMWLAGISLERISLGALIIALGMLVDNAIVVTEGILVRIEKGEKSLEAASNVVKQTIWPLFGATIVGILAFAPISMSQDSTGEYTASLFYVILTSLLLSWMFAVTASPLFCHLFLKKSKKKQDTDMYDTRFYNSYRAFLKFCMRKHWLTISLMIVLLAASIYGFGFVKQSFFPNSTTPIFYIDFWRSQGTDIRATAKEMGEIDKYIRNLPEVVAVTSVVGMGAQRFTLVYTPEKANTSYGQFIIELKNYEDIDRLSKQIKKYIITNYPDTEPKIQKMRLGPGRTAKIEARISGPNPTTLREISQKIQDIMASNPNSMDIRDDWRHRTKVIEPHFSQTQARYTGINREDLTRALQMAFSGIQVGLYREYDELIPIVLRPPASERLQVDSIHDLQIWSPLKMQWIPIDHIVSEFEVSWEDSIVRRRNRMNTITVSCDPKQGSPLELFSEIRPKIEKIKLPPGYFIEWGGEYEDSHDAQVGLAKQLPMGFFLMFVTVMLLFKTVKQPLIIWACVPLSFIGVTVGLLVTNMAFGFMALLGFLSLTGMLIKNAIVLVDQIKLELSLGTQPFSAIIESAVSRVRPVSLAAITTVLGMIPLLFDIFFQSMAVVIMFGITFATILTLIMVPVLYGVMYRISEEG